MLTGFMMAVPIPNKNTEMICNAYRDHIYCTFGGSSRILTDNGSEFKNHEMKQVCETLGVKHIFSPVYMPESNGCLEGWHRFFKACISKHICGGGVEWDELVPLAVSAYNFFRCQSTRESLFMLMFGRDPITSVAKLLEPKPRYYGEKGGTLQRDTLRCLYTIVVENIRKAREKKPKVGEEKKPHKFKINDMVLVKDPDSAVFEPRYQPYYRVTAIFGDNRIKVQDEKGHKSLHRSSHVKYVEPSEKIVQQLPSKEILQNYGRSSKLLIAARDIPDLQFDVEKTESGSEVREHSENSLRSTGKVIEVIETDVPFQSVSRKPSVTLQDSDYYEHSQNSLDNTAGVTLEQLIMKETAQLDRKVREQETSSKYRECSQNSQSSKVCVEPEQMEAVERTHGYELVRDSKHRECSQKLADSRRWMTHAEKRNPPERSPV